MSRGQLFSGCVCLSNSLKCIGWWMRRLGFNCVCVCVSSPLTLWHAFRLFIYIFIHSVLINSQPLAVGRASSLTKNTRKKNPIRSRVRGWWKRQEEDSEINWPWLGDQMAGLPIVFLRNQIHPSASSHREIHDHENWHSIIFNCKLRFFHSIRGRHWKAFFQSVRDIISSFDFGPARMND